MANLENRVAIVTGAASGIGLACAQRFAREGAIVVGTDVQEPEDWQAVQDASPGSWFRILDVTDGDAQRAVALQAVEEHGRIDILVTAAGIGDGGPVSMIEEDAWDRVLDINLKGTYLSIKSVLDTMMAQRSGSIITVASVEGLHGTEGGSAYNASKENLTASVRRCRSASKGSGLGSGGMLDGNVAGMAPTVPRARRRRHARLSSCPT